MAKNKKAMNVELRMIEAEHPGQMPLLEMWIDGERVIQSHKWVFFVLA